MRRDASSSQHFIAVIEIESKTIPLKSSGTLIEMIRVSSDSVPRKKPFLCVLVKIKPFEKGLFLESAFAST